MRIKEHLTNLKKILTIIVFIIAILIGSLSSYLIVSSSYKSLIDRRTQADRNKNTLNELSLLISQNQKLIANRNSLEEEVEQLKTTYSATRLVRQNIDDYVLLLGDEPAKGNGVILTIDIDLAPFWFIDIVNDLFDLGAEAIEINGVRYTPKTSIIKDMDSDIVVNNKKIQKPYILKIVGETNLLYKGLTNKSGLVEKLKLNFPNKEDKIILITKEDMYLN